MTQAGKTVRQKGTEGMVCGGLCVFLGGDWNFISKIYQVTVKRSKQYMPTFPVPWGKRQKRKALQLLNGSSFDQRRSNRARR